MTAKRNSDSLSPKTLESIGIDYRAGIKTLRQMADEYSVSHTHIKNLAKRHGWERDLSGRIAAKAQAIVSKAAVSTSVSSGNAETENAVVEANAQMQADVILAHRKDLQRYKKLCLDMLAELEAETKEPELFEELGVLLRSEDKNGQDKLNDAYHKAISLPGRIDGVKKLAEVLKTMVALERQAFGIRDDDDGKPKDHVPLEDRLKKYAQDAAIESAGNVTRLPRAA